MKKLFTVLVLSMLSVGCSSVPQEALDQAHTNAIICDMFILQMDSGNTTRQQEQELIKAQRRAWYAQDHALNDAELPMDMRNGVDGE